MSNFLTRRKFLSLLAVAVAACGLTMALAPTAFASGVPYNTDVAITAKAVNPSYTEAGQTIEVTMQFSTADLSGITATAAEVYLQANTTIAGRAISSTAYNRDVYDVAVNASTKQITFKIGPNTAAGMTANFSAELKIVANLGDFGIGDAMGADVETIIGTQLAIAKNGASSSSAAIFNVTARAQARSMNHILITDVIGGVETAIFSGTGTFANGGITIHSHSFTLQTVANYAASIVSVANGIGSSYTFTNDGGGQFTITNGGADCSNIKVYVYDGDYLNAHQLSVGAIWEPEWDPNA